MSQAITLGDQVVERPSPAVTPARPSDPAELEVARLRGLVDLLGAALNLNEPTGSALMAPTRRS
jgi:hypothetical protein